VNSHFDLRINSFIMHILKVSTTELLTSLDPRRESRFCPFLCIREAPVNIVREWRERRSSTPLLSRCQCWIRKKGLDMVTTEAHTGIVNSRV
jgi:hypothetical protein